eukprot:gene27266-2520_t
MGCTRLALPSLRLRRNLIATIKVVASADAAPLPTYPYCSFNYTPAHVEPVKAISCSMRATAMGTRIQAFGLWPNRFGDPIKKPSFSGPPPHHSALRPDKTSCPRATALENP